MSKFQVDSDRIRLIVTNLALFVLIGGDAVRYSIGWTGWGICIGILLISTLVLFFRSDWRDSVRLVPWPLAAILGLMVVGSAWSNYRVETLGASFLQLGTTIFALMIGSAYSWRELLGMFANNLRVILVGSALFELFAALVIKGPIAPFFPNYSGPTPPTRAYYWTQGNLLTDGRVQGLVGNSNMLAYMAMIGLVLFGVEVAIRSVPIWVSVLSIGATLPMLVLSGSGSITFASLAILAAAVVSIFAEGKPKNVRHNYYRITWSAVGVMALFILTYRAEVFGLIGKSPDMTHRTIIWGRVLKLIDQRPLQGWGWSSYWIPWVEPYKGLVVFNHVPALQAHDAYLDVWLQLGIFGLGLFLLLIGLTFVRTWRLAVHHTSPLYLWPILVFVGIITQNLTESRMLEEIGWVMLVLFAVKVRESEEKLEPRGELPKRSRIAKLAAR